MGKYKSVDENVVARGLPEPNSVFPLIALVLYSPIQFSKTLRKVSTVSKENHPCSTQPPQNGEGRQSAGPRMSSEGSPNGTTDMVENQSHVLQGLKDNEVKPGWVCHRKTLMGYVKSKVRLAGNRQALGQEVVIQVRLENGRGRNEGCAGRADSTLLVVGSAIHSQEHSANGDNVVVDQRAQRANKGQFSAR